MQPLFTTEQFKQAGQLQHMPLKCKQCSATYYLSKGDISKLLGSGVNGSMPLNYCSVICFERSRKPIQTTGRSKFEVWVETKLNEVFPRLNIYYNRRDVVGNGLELDIYIPDLLLAFEINGPGHYQPIYGDKQLETTRKKDKWKLLQCYDKGIELHIIDTSRMGNFTEWEARPYLDSIVAIIKYALYSRRLMG